MEGASNDWLTNVEAAAYLKCSKQFLEIDRVYKKHGIPFARLGCRIRYRRQDLDAFLEKTKRQ